MISATDQTTRWKQAALALALCALTFLAYVPACRNGFVWDDANFLTDNPLIHDPGGLYRFWCTRDAPDYFPLSSTTLWLEWRLWHKAAAGYHVVNVLLHALSAVLLWRVLLRLGVRAAWLAALIFALHPVTVQSVAWISERKNTLSMLLFLSAALAYLRYDDEGRRRWYAAALIAFLLALLAKSSVVMFPFALGLCLWWKRGELSRPDVLRLLPFLGMSFILGLVTVSFQHGDMAENLVISESLLTRTLQAAAALCFYLYKAIVPVGLCFMYPRWDIRPASPADWIPLLAVAGAAWWLWRARHGPARPVAFALAYHALMLLPVLGFVNMSIRYYTLVSDHLQYLSLIGPAALAAAAAATALDRLRPRLRMAGVAAILAVVVTLGALTWNQTTHYRDDETLWADIHRKNDQAWILHNKLAHSMVVLGRPDWAIYHLRKVCEQRPRDAAAYNNLGMALAAVGRVEEGIAQVRIAVQLAPGSARVRANLERLLREADVPRAKPLPPRAPAQPPPP